MAKSKLTPELQATVCDLLAAGNTDKDVCAAVGIHHSTFYDWLKRGDEATRGKFSAFSDAITRARADARQGAVDALRQAIKGGGRTVTEKTVLDTETRMGKDGQPYEYRKEHTERAVTYHPSDWRAAVEYLKRRDADNWSEKINTEQHITIEGAVETAADEFERIIRKRHGTESVSSEPDDAAKGGSAV